MRGLAFNLAVSATLLTTAAVRADFVITGQPPTELPAQIQTPVRTPNRAPARPEAAAAPSQTPAPSAFKTVQGFGEQVPLSFAVKQIVPKTVKVYYGPGVDPAALVDWKGGQPWNDALRAAVKPLGLRLVMTATMVEIKR
jgi:hypothetical protein